MGEFIPNLSGARLSPSDISTYKHNQLPSLFTNFSSAITDATKSVSGGYVDENLPTMFTRTK